QHPRQTSCTPVTARSRNMVRSTVVGVMSLAKIASGDGYEYYLRSIATHDANERGNQALADYYSERGESPGRWWGSGLADLTVLDDAGVVVSSITAGEE